MSDRIGSEKKLLLPIYLTGVKKNSLSFFNGYQTEKQGRGYPPYKNEEINKNIFTESIVAKCSDLVGQFRDLGHCPAGPRTLDATAELSDGVISAQ